MDKNFLEIDSVLKKFGEKKVLSDVYLAVETNDIAGLFGKNGAGKSTLLKIIFGSQSADNKFISLDGHSASIPFMFKTGVGYLPQHSFLPKNLIVEEAVLFFINSDQMATFKDDSLIGDILRKKVKILSAGELRYLEIRLILFSEKKIVLLDEPFKGLSPLLIERVKKLIVEHSKSKGIIITDHDYLNVIDIITKSYILHHGKLLQLDSPFELADFGYLPRQV